MRGAEFSGVRQVVDQSGRVTGAETIVYVYHCHAGSARVEHPQKRGYSAESNAISSRSGYAYDWFGDQTAHYGNKGALHPGHDNDYGRFFQSRLSGFQPVYSGHPDIIDSFNARPKNPGGQSGLFGHSHIGYAGGQHSYFAGIRQKG